MPVPIPVPIEGAIRASLFEVEGCAYLDANPVEDGLISGSMAAGVVHLRAELIEKAAYSLPASPGGDSGWSTNLNGHNPNHTVNRSAYRSGAGRAHDNHREGA